MVTVGTHLFEDLIVLAPGASHDDFQIVGRVRHVNQNIADDGPNIVAGQMARVFRTRDHQVHPRIET